MRAVANSGRRSVTVWFSSSQACCVPARSDRLEDSADDHYILIWMTVRSNIVHCPFHNECTASIPFNVQYAESCS